jgi:hypothetical protein
MTNPKDVATKENVAGQSKPTSSSEATRSSGEARSPSEERRFQNALEDDEVNEALRALRSSGATTKGRSRP